MANRTTGGAALVKVSNALAQARATVQAGTEARATLQALDAGELLGEPVDAKRAAELKRAVAAGEKAAGVVPGLEARLESAARAYGAARAAALRKQSAAADKEAVALDKQARELADQAGALLVRAKFLRAEIPQLAAAAQKFGGNTITTAALIAAATEEAGA